MMGSFLKKCEFGKLQRAGRRALCAGLAAVMLLLSFAGTSAAVYAEDSLMQVTADVLKVRSGAGNGYEIAGRVYYGNIVTVHSVADGWASITYNDLNGYVSADYLEAYDPTAGADPLDDDFEASIAEFPESYKPYLRRLHAQYPNWTFTAENTGLDWDTVLEAECVLGRSLVENSMPASWKATMNGAYDPATGTWYTLDSGRWVQASAQIVEYYLDPRNYLDPTYIYAFLDQRYDPDMADFYASGISLVAAGTFLEGTFENSPSDPTVYNYTDVLLEVGSINGVNPLVMAATLQIEQGKSGGGGCISGTEPGYEGYYDYFNVGAYKTRTMTAVQRGLWYASGQDSGQTSYGRPWNTRYGSILGGSQFYAQNYLNAGQQTLYYKRFNVGPETTHTHFTHQYMTGTYGAAEDARNLSKVYQSQTELAVNFIIPVFDNMPDSAVSKPYSNVVGSGDISSSGQVSTAGTWDPADVQPDDPDPAAADPGDTDDPGTSDPADVQPATFDTALTVGMDGFISGIQPGSSADDVVTALGVNGGSVVLRDASGNELASSDAAGTGTSVSVYDASGALQATYYIVIHGDINGDGSVSMVDLLRIRKHMLGAVTLNGPYAAAADLNSDGELSMIDLLRMRKCMLGVFTITQ